MYIIVICMSKGLFCFQLVYCTVLKKRILYLKLLNKHYSYIFILYNNLFLLVNKISLSLYSDTLYSLYLINYIRLHSSEPHVFLKLCQAKVPIEVFPLHVLFIYKLFPHSFNQIKSPLSGNRYTTFFNNVLGWPSLIVCV